MGSEKYNNNNKKKLNFTLKNFKHNRKQQQQKNKPSFLEILINNFFRRTNYFYQLKTSLKII